VRAKLVAVLLAMTLVPALLVSIVGSELIRGSVARWFDAPMGDVLASANSIAADYYRVQQDAVASRAARLARSIGFRDPYLASPEALTRTLVADTPPGTTGEVRIYRVVSDGSDAPVFLMRAGTVGPGAADGDALSRLAVRAIAAGQSVRTVERGADGAEVLRAASPIRRDDVGPVTGAVVAVDLLPATLAARARGVTDAYEGYQQLRVLRQPLTGVYLSFFLMLTLMILLTATWLGLYIAKRITRHLHQLAAAADEIRAGHLDYRVDVPNRDEFGSLAESFNRMAAELSASRSRLERSAVELEAKHVEVEHRRRYVETVLERLATGVLSVDAGGRIRTWNSAATRLLDIEGTAAGKTVSEVFGAPGLDAFATLLGEEGLKVQEARAHDLTATRGGREIHLSVVTSPLRADDGSQNGVVVVFDDVSPLVRAQKVAAWREVARRLAHEIKNPLTPIQLSAERLRRHFADAPAATRDLVAECATTIVGEVESLKGLVDEFSQFARMPAPRAVPTDLHGVLDDALGLYDGLLSEVRFHRVYAPSLPRVSVDPEQMRRVVLNLVDNAVEAMDRHGNIEVSTAHDAAHSLVNVIVADDGPGIPPGERDKLFLPYYSTKKRGSGLGLAIVRRIVAEHGGSIEVAENLPHGTRFTIELPC
jgi:two-component system nitrogen regulation sensor histidine kinase NtrY